MIVPVLPLICLVALETHHVLARIEVNETKYGLLTSAVEQIAYHPADKLIYGVGNGIIHVLDASNVTNLQILRSYENSAFIYTDVEVCGDYVFIAIDNAVNKSDGLVHVYSKYNQTTSDMELLHSIRVGSLPDMLHPRKDCNSLVIAMEAEAYTDNGIFHDPESAVVIVSFPEGVATQGSHVVESFGFQKYNDRVTELLPSGVRFVYRENNNTFSADVEPEYVAIDEENDEAFIMLQENNAIATVDLKTKNITSLFGLGYKEWGHIDTSNKDGGIRISYWPIRAWYLPDELKYYKWKGHRLLFTANEGDSKQYDHFNEEMRGHDINVDTQLDATIHPMVKSALQDDTLLGRLKLSKYDGLNSKGQYEALYAYGGRGFSIWSASTKSLLYDSGSDVEDMTALYCPHLFNAKIDPKEQIKRDVRSDDKGPETESITVGELNDRLYIFIGNEKPGTIAVYSVGSDVTKPRFETIFCDGIPDSNRTAGELFDEKLLYAVDPEDLKFYPARQSPTGQPVLFVCGTVSSSISILHLSVSPDEADKTPLPDPKCPDKPEKLNSAAHSLIGNRSLINTVLVFIVLCLYIRF